MYSFIHLFIYVFFYFGVLSCCVVPCRVLSSLINVQFVLIISILFISFNFFSFRFACGMDDRLKNRVRRLVSKRKKKQIAKK